MNPSNSTGGLESDCACMLECLKLQSFSSRSFLTKKEIISCCRPTPDVVDHIQTNTKLCVRHFKKNTMKKLTRYVDVERRQNYTVGFVFYFLMNKVLGTIPGSMI